MNALRRTERRALAVLGTVSCATALGMLVEDARGAADSTTHFRPAQRGLPRVVDVLPRRDPFAGDPANRAPATATSMTPPVLPPGIALPPAPPAEAAALRVTATVSGAHPLAVVDGAGGARIVTLGDALGARSVVAIDAAGVHLSDGTTVRPTPPSRSDRGTP
jgi:hypothetical protein